MYLFMMVTMYNTLVLENIIQYQSTTLVEYSVCDMGAGNNGRDALMRHAPPTHNLKYVVKLLASFLNFRKKKSKIAFLLSCYP
jgi:hypothetical protein